MDIDDIIRAEMGNSTFAPPPNSNSTTGNSTTPDDEIHVQFSTHEIIIILFNLLAYILSIITMIIHLFKFFNSKQKQNLQIKNLTSYCACLLVMYLYIIISVTSIPKLYPASFYVTDLYIHVAASCFLLIMAFYTCMCIIVSQKGYHFPCSDERQLVIYSVIGWMVPVPLSLMIYFLESSPFFRITTILFIRFLAVIPFFISLWYIKSIGWNRTNIIKNFVIHVRLLILTGAISFIPNTIYGIFLLLDEQAKSTTVFAVIAETLYLWEGFIVGLCFTFRKGTFENRNENPIELTNGYTTEVGQVLDDDDDAS